MFIAAGTLRSVMNYLVFTVHFNEPVSRLQKNDRSKGRARNRKSQRFLHVDTSILAFRLPQREPH
jgi:hypothetical protein